MSAVVFLIVIVLIVVIFVGVRIYSDGVMNLNYYELDGKILVITGTTSGIGYVIAQKCSEKKAVVIMLNRDKARGDEVAVKIQTETGNPNVYNVYIDLSDLSTFQQAHKEIVDISKQFASPEATTTPVDIFVASAGCMMTPYKKTAQGYEYQIGVNHFGHYVLFKLLWRNLKHAEAPKVIVVSSLASKWVQEEKIPLSVPEEVYSPWKNYCLSKLANAMFAKQVSKKYPKFFSAAVNPGIVNTPLWRELTGWRNTLKEIAFKLIAKSPLQGAQTALYAIFTPDLENGGYFSDCKLVEPNPIVLNDKARSKLWDGSKTEYKKHLKLLGKVEGEDDD